MNEKERDALIHVLIVMEKLDIIIDLRENLYADLMVLHKWLDTHHPLET